MKYFSIATLAINKVLSKILPETWLKKENQFLNILNTSIWVLLTVTWLGVLVAFTSNTLIGTGFVKQTLFVVITNIALLVWLIIQLYDRKLTIFWSGVHTLGLVFVIAVAVATVFSQYVWGSFVGTTVTTINFVSVWSLFGFFFLISQRPRAELSYWIKLLLAGSVILIFFSFAQFLGWFILPNAVTKISAFTPFGTIRSLALLVVLLLPLIFTWLLQMNGWKRIFGIALVLLIVVFLQITLSNLVWWVAVLAVASWLLVRYAVNKNVDFKGRLISVLVLIFALVMALWPVRSLINPSLPANVRLTNTLSYTIAADSITSGIKHFALGSGPSTFAQVYMQKRPLQLNDANLVRGDQSIELWGVRFVQPSNVVSLLLVTTGVVGTLLLFSMLFWALVMGWKRVVIENDNLWLQGIFTTLFIASVAMFAQSFSLPIFVTIFGLLGLLMVGHKQPNTIAFKINSLSGIVIILVAVSLGVVGVITAKTQAERFLASHFAAKSFISRQDGFYEQAVNEAGRAVQLVPNDDVFTRLLVESWLNYAIDLSNTEQIDQQKLQTAVLASIQAAARAEKIDPTNGRNLAQLAFVFRQVAPFFDGAANLSAETYARAEQLEPTNPALPTERARSLVTAAQFAERNAENGTDLTDKEIENYRQSKINEAESALAEAVALKSDYAPARFLLANIAIQQNRVGSAVEELNQLQTSNPRDAGLHYQRGILLYSQADYENAKNAFESAVNISENFANARYFLGLSLSELGETEKAISQFEAIKQIDPNSSEAIDQILANLRAGRDALTNVNSESVENLDEPLEAEEVSN